MKFRMLSHRLAVGLVCLAAAGVLRAWDYEGHRMVNQLALAALPEDFPAFVRQPANAERVAFLAGEPDRWRNVGDLPIKQFNSLDHYCNLEQLVEVGIDPARVTSFRYDFVVQFAAGRAAHADRFAPIDPARNSDHTREWPGFAPWAITEYYGKLKSAFSYLKTFEESGGTAEEIANAKANIVYTMGLMGHMVGDCAQPLHTTRHHNGWVGENPQGFTQWTGFHAWIDGGFIAKAGLRPEPLLGRVVPGRYLSQAPQPDGRDAMFVAVMAYLMEQHKFVESLYALDKKGAFKEEVAAAADSEGRAFIEERLLAGGHMLASIWITAWKSAGPDNYLRGQLAKRQLAAGQTP